MKHLGLWIITSCARMGGGGWTHYNLCYNGDHTGHTKGQCRRWHMLQRVEVLPSPLAQPRTLQIGAVHKERWWGKGSSMQYKCAHQMKLLWPTLAALHWPLSTTQDPHSKVTPATVTTSRHLHTTAASQCTSITRQVEHTLQRLPFPTDNLVLY